MHCTSCGHGNTQNSRYCAGCGKALGRRFETGNAEYRGDLSKVAQDFGVSSFGLVTSIATAVILVTVEQSWGFALYSWTFWFIIPAGAICSGFAAASGYYLGARLFNHRPTGVLLLNVAAISTWTFFLVHYLNYYFMTVDGKSVRDYIQFPDFLAAVLSHQSIQLGYRGHFTGPAIEMGQWGYLYALLQIVGFALGGIAVYWYLKEIPYCENCSRYFTEKEIQSRYTWNADELAKAIVLMRKYVVEGRPQMAIDVNSRVGSAVSANIGGRDGCLRSEVVIHYCKVCGKHRMRLEVSKWVKDDWKALPILETFTDQPLSASRETAIAHSKRV